jgi:hypothetical protein
MTPGEQRRDRPEACYRSIMVREPAARTDGNNVVKAFSIERLSDGQGGMQRNFAATTSVANRLATAHPFQIFAILFRSGAPYRIKVRTLM